MTGPRIFFAMADDGLFFRKIASIHPRFKTPHVAIGLAAVLASIFVMFRNFEQLADAFVLGIWPFYAGGAAAVYSLRRARPDLQRPYRVPGYPVTPAVFIAAAILLLVNAFVAERMALVVFAIIAAGIPVFWIWRSAVPDLK
jgi:APA family basic amino acid/polyamine antiporter